MALSPAERRQRRDERAQQRINPDTGQPFRNYNQLDTWQRNQKAKAEGFTSRAAKRIRNSDVTKAKQTLPETYQMVFGSKKRVTEREARDFMAGLGPGGLSHSLRRAYTQRAGSFNWQLWRNEYSQATA
jgi:hypothetical protein